MNFNVNQAFHCKMSERTKTHPTLPEALSKKKSGSRIVVEKGRIVKLTQDKQGRRKIAVKVLDIFGNDTMTVVEVSV